MADQNLEIEIENTSNRIEIRQAEINLELDQLVDQINNYTTWAWRFVWSGAVVAFASTIFYLCKNTESGFGLNLLGDFMAGTVASIWSLAGLFFIYVAFLGQKQQLLNQQLEIMYSQLEVKYTRLELYGQKKEMMEQNETLRQQKFENTFFQLLSLFNSIVNSIDIRNRKTLVVTASGRDCFVVFYKRLAMHLNSIIYGEESMMKDLSIASVSQIVEAYEKFYTESQTDMSHYFRTIYHIIKFIDSSEIQNKKQYISIARAQLSSFEQIIIFYNCLHANGNEKFKPLIEKYALFKNIDNALIVNQKHLEEYAMGAYGH
ncbi:putative phage abortive infection protein [Cytophaga aurantiaca]|uniref:putative phage abortive infection protein n=1 Tax=Cytophaga aurantiaca TaxID=29530 RepID=UPI0003799758|nr:putative phage abortive infection protein [Cytophaga aurantiaca]